ncbi:hypothetical protein PG996_011349 [Apiospora saccharicola]|uniref:Uncharacterized protein n=1 Tax=Apiospora saccharicola TaxID=335842 RepID=A0ABR1UFB9_9PEZI
MQRLHVHRRGNQQPLPVSRDGQRRREIFEGSYTPHAAGDGVGPVQGVAVAREQAGRPSVHETSVAGRGE